MTVALWSHGLSRPAFHQLTAPTVPRLKGTVLSLYLSPRAWDWPCLPTVHPVLSPSFRPQVLHDCQRYRSNIREIGDLWVGVRTVSRQCDWAEGGILG